MAAQDPHFSCFSLQESIIAGTIFVSNNGLDGEANRTRKPHTKSRRGCKNCKVRKVKCDEESPCRNCVKRGQDCSFLAAPEILASSATVQSHPPIREISSSPLSNPRPPPSAINLGHMRLLHHFQNFTSETFIMDPKTWKDSVLDLALQTPFLMRIVFLVTSTHLQHLQPDERSHKVTALENLSVALPQFRETLANAASNFEKHRKKALIACAMLLVQYSWTCDSEGWRSMQQFYRGLTSVILQSNEDLFADAHDPFASMLAYSPRLHIEAYFNHTPIPPDIENIFAHVITCEKISDTQSEKLNCMILPSKSLMTILSSLSLGWDRLGAEGLTRDVARYLFSWPALLPTFFVEMLMKEEQRALVIMLYYFAAVSRLPVERFWWMKNRGTYMYGKILEHHGDKCVECTGYGIAIFEGGQG